MHYCWVHWYTSNHNLQWWSIKHMDRDCSYLQWYGLEMGAPCVLSACVPFVHHPQPLPLEVGLHPSMVVCYVVAVATWNVFQDASISQHYVLCFGAAR